MPRSCVTLLLTVFLSMGGADAGAGETADAHRVLVVGATGRQGGAVARELLKRGYAVRGLTRSPVSDRARRMSSLGVEMVQGDLEDPDSLSRALDGVWGVFAMTDFWEHGYEGEVRQGRNIIDAAKASGVEMFVFSSVGSADRATGIPHFDSKFEIEEYLRASGLNHAVIRPVSFMENWALAELEVADGVLEDPRDPQSRTQMISVRDIGRFAAEAFDHPDEWSGKTLDIAGSEYTLAQLMEVLGNGAGRPVEQVQVPWEDYEADAGEEMTAMMKWFNDVGYNVDVSGLRAKYPWMVRFEDYLQSAWSD